MKSSRWVQHKSKVKVQSENVKNSDKTLKNQLGFKQFKVNMTYFTLLLINITKDKIYKILNINSI